MATAEVTVQRLRLQAPRAVPGLLPTVEDALRVSSKPPALLNRLVLVRRLRLRAAAGASAQTLALQLERAWQQLAAHAQPMELAGDTAEAVWAPSLAVARQMLLKRWLRGEASEAWFWRRIAPPQAAEQAWPARAIALMLMADEDEPVAVVAVTPSMRQVSQARALLTLITDQGMAAQFVDAIDDAQALAVLRTAAALDESIEWAHRRLHAQALKPRAATPQARLLEFVKTLSPAAEGSPIQRLAMHSSASPSEAMQASARVEKPDEPVRALLASLESLETEAPARRRVLTALQPDVDLKQGLASPWSGLWLLLPILLRRGLDDTEDPLAAWAGAMRSACRRFRIPDDDPIHTALADLDMPHAEDPGWLRSARLAAVHDARLPLLRIARRRGEAWVSTERIDIEFPTASLDLRIRRAGFDINPGFIPWLGRIVHFHYPS